MNVNENELWQNNHFGSAFRLLKRLELSQKGSNVSKTLRIGICKKYFPRQLSLTQANILQSQNQTQEYMTIVFSKVIFTDESQMDFDRWAKVWIFSNPDISVGQKKATKRQ